MSATTWNGSCPQFGADGLLNSFLLAVNHLCHIQGRGLASNATVRREAIIQSSTLSRSGELFLHSQPLGHPGLLGGICDKVIAHELETKQKAMVLSATVGNSGGVASISNRGKSETFPEVPAEAAAEAAATATVACAVCYCYFVHYSGFYASTTNFHPKSATRKRS